METTTKMNFKFEKDETAVYDGKEVVVIDRRATMSTIDSKGTVKDGRNIYAIIYGTDYGEVESVYEEDLAKVPIDQQPKVIYEYEEDDDILKFYSLVFGSVVAAIMFSAFYPLIENLWTTI